MIKKIIINYLYKELEETKRKQEQIKELIETNERKIEEDKQKKLIRQSKKEENKKLNQTKTENSINTSNNNPITQIIIQSNNGIDNAQIEDILSKYTKVNTNNILNTDIKGNYNIKIIEIEGQEENNLQSYQENTDCKEKEDDEKVLFKI